MPKNLLKSNKKPISRVGRTGGQMGVVAIIMRIAEALVPDIKLTVPEALGIAAFLTGVVSYLHNFAEAKGWIPNILEDPVGPAVDPAYKPEGGGE